MTDSDASEEDAVQINDPEEYVNERRLKQIFDTRKKLRERSLRVNAAKNDPEASRYQALCMYRSLVKSYIMETEPLLKRYEPGLRLLKKKDFGSVRLPPRIESREASGRGSTGMAKVYEPEMTNSADGLVTITDPPEEIVTYSLEGLQSIFVTPDPLVASYQLERHRYTRSGEEFTHTVEGQIDFGILDDMVRTVNDFLAEIGFTVDPEPEDDPAMI